MTRKRSIPPKPEGRPPHVPTEAMRAQIQAMASFGIPHADIAAYVEKDLKTLYKYYRRELDIGMTKGNAAVAGYLFNNAKKGNVVAQIFWLKARANWSDKMEIDHRSGDGSMTPPGRIELVAGKP